MRGNLNLENDPFRVLLSSFSPSSNQNYLSNIPVDRRIAVSDLLTNTEVVNSASGYYAFDADDVYFPSLSGPTVSYIQIYKDTGDPATSTLIYSRGVNFTPLGVDLTIVWPTTNPRIMASYFTNSTTDFYTAARRTIMLGQIDFVNDDIRVALLTNEYSFTPHVHATFSDIPSSAVVATAPILDKSVDDVGYLRASNVTFPSLTGNPVTQYVVYKDTGNATTSPLIARFGYAMSGLPLTPTGRDVVLAWPTSPGILRF